MVATHWRLSWDSPIASSGPSRSPTRRPKSEPRSPRPRVWVPGSVTRGRRSSCARADRPQMTWTSGDKADMRIERVEEPRVFGFTWHIYGLPADDPRRTYVEFTLEPVGAGTRLTVIESGFAQLPDDAYRKAYGGNTEGWAHELAALASGGPATATDLADRLPITRQAIAKHLALLAEAGLVTTEPGERRRVRYRLRSAPMQVAQQFLAALARDWDGRLDALKDHLDRGA